MIAKMKLFLYSVEYRKVVVKRVVFTLGRCVVKPIAYVKAKLDVWKFLREHPDNWDRYVEWRRVENQHAECERIRKLMEYHKQVVDSITQMNLWMLIYVEKNDPKNKNERIKLLTLEQIEKKFTSFQEKALEGIENCIELGAMIPDEFPELVRVCKFNYCKSMTELDNFSEGMCSLLGNFSLGKNDLNSSEV